MLLRRLGHGGNAEVWESSRDEDPPVALKVLHSFKPEREPYKRFQSEVEVLQQLGRHSGVVALIDASLPERPSDSDPPWLAMEIATPMKEALGGNPQLDEVVAAIASVAGTLADLADRDIFHRDIKPENLFELNKNWAVGDFGLASFPGKEALTTDGRKLGPMWYLAPEMLNTPTQATGGPVDVYSLAKTLWVLSAGQNYPLPGQIRFDVEQTTLENCTQHSRAALLDVLIEKSTEHAPSKRPSMAEFRDELQAWLSPVPTSRGPVDISDLAASIHPYVSRGREQLEKRASVERSQKEAFTRILQEVAERLKPYERKCTQLMGQEAKEKVNIDASEVKWNRKELSQEVSRTAEYAKDKAWPHVSAHYSTPLSVPGFFVVRYHGIIELYLERNGELSCLAVHLVMKENNHGLVSPPNIVWHQMRTAPIGSARCEEVVGSILASWEENFRDGVEAFVNLVRTTDSGAE